MLVDNCITPDNTYLVFVGDIVNKGPKSIETLRFVQNFGAETVRGNHEEHVIRTLRKIRDDPEFQVNKKYAWISELKEEDLRYLENLPYTISIPSLDALIVHAGVHPWRPIASQSTDDMINMRNIVDGDTCPRTSKDIKEGLPWASYWSRSPHIYYGHDARRKLQLRQDSTGLDTGCLYGGKLTGVFLRPQKTFVSVDAFDQYIKPEGEA